MIRTPCGSTDASASDTVVMPAPDATPVRDSSVYATAKQQIGVDLISVFDHDPGQLATNRWTFATKGQ